MNSSQLFSVSPGMMRHRSMGQGPCAIPTDTRACYTIRDIPAGRYRVAVRGPNLGPTRCSKVSAGAKAVVDRDARR
jgi:hypothetical protein